MDMLHANSSSIFSINSSFSTWQRPSPNATVETFASQSYDDSLRSYTLGTGTFVSHYEENFEEEVAAVKKKFSMASIFRKGGRKGGEEGACGREEAGRAQAQGGKRASIPAALEVRLSLSPFHFSLIYSFS